MDQATGLSTLEKACWPMKQRVSRLSFCAYEMLSWEVKLVGKCHMQEDRGTKAHLCLINCCSVLIYGVFLKYWVWWLITNWGCLVKVGCNFILRLECVLISRSVYGLENSCCIPKFHNIKVWTDIEADFAFISACWQIPLVMDVWAVWQLLICLQGKLLMQLPESITYEPVKLSVQ